MAANGNINDIIPGNTYHKSDKYSSPEDLNNDMELKYGDSSMVTLNNDMELKMVTRNNDMELKYGDSRMVTLNNDMELKYVKFTKVQEAYNA